MGTLAATVPLTAKAANSSESTTQPEAVAAITRCQKPQSTLSTRPALNQRPQVCATRRAAQDGGGLHRWSAPIALLASCQALLDPPTPPHHHAWVTVLAKVRRRRADPPEQMSGVHTLDEQEELSCASASRQHLYFRHPAGQRFTHPRDRRRCSEPQQ